MKIQSLSSSIEPDAEESGIRTISTEKLRQRGYGMRVFFWAGSRGERWRNVRVRSSLSLVLKGVAFERKHL